MTLWHNDPKILRKLILRVWRENAKSSRSEVIKSFINEGYDAFLITKVAMTIKYNQIRLSKRKNIRKLVKKFHVYYKCRNWVCECC